MAECSVFPYSSGLPLQILLQSVYSSPDTVRVYVGLGREWANYLIEIICLKMYLNNKANNNNNNNTVY